MIRNWVWANDNNRKRTHSKRVYGISFVLKIGQSLYITKMKIFKQNFRVRVNQYTNPRQSAIDLFEFTFRRTSYLYINIIMLCNASRSLYTFLLPFELFSHHLCIKNIDYKRHCSNFQKHCFFTVLTHYFIIQRNAYWLIYGFIWNGISVLTTVYINYSE